MHELRVELRLEHVRCIDEADGPGDAEPYLWVVFFKLDGDTVTIDAAGRLVGRATFSFRGGDHGDLGDTDVGDGDVVPVPAPLGFHATNLAPIRFEVPIAGMTEAGGAVGCVVVMMEQDNTPGDAIARGHRALDEALIREIDGVVGRLNILAATPSDADVRGIKERVGAAVRKAIESSVTAGEWILGLGNMDDPIGAALLLASHGELVRAGAEGVKLHAWWLGGFARFLGTGPQPRTIGAFAPGDYQRALAGAGVVSLPRGWRVRLFTGPDFDGEQLVVERSAAIPVRAYRSFRVEQGEVVLHAAPDHGGATLRLDRAGRHDVGDLALVGNDRIASMRIPVGYRVVAFSEAGFTGDRVVFERDVARIGAPLAGRISSLIVEKGEATSTDGEWELRARVTGAPAPHVPPPPRPLDVRYLVPPRPTGTSTVTVEALDAATRAPVAGRVVINGADAGATNEPFAFAFASRVERRVLVEPLEEPLPGEPRPPRPRPRVVFVRIWLDEVVVTAPGYAAAPLVIEEEVVPR